MWDRINRNLVGGTYWVNALWKRTDSSWLELVVIIKGTQQLKARSWLRIAKPGRNALKIHMTRKARDRDEMILILAGFHSSLSYPAETCGRHTETADKINVLMEWSAGSLLSDRGVPARLEVYGQLSELVIIQASHHFHHWMRLFPTAAF